jgi:hypothetical protein
MEDRTFVVERRFVNNSAQSSNRSAQLSAASRFNARPPCRENAIRLSIILQLEGDRTA